MTPPPTPQNAAAPGPSGPWFESALEVDRYLDGEGDPQERARREAEVAARPDLSVRLARRTAFLEALRAGRWSPGGSSAADLRRLEARVRAVLAQDAEPVRARSRWRPVLVGAAAVLAGLGAWLLVPRDRDGSNAWAVSMAAQVLDWQPSAFSTCAQHASAGDVHRSPLVREGELQVRGCAEQSQHAHTSVAQLWRPEELQVVGYVAVPASGDMAADEIGITEVESGRVVVFDMLDRRQRIYVAVNSAALKAKHTSGERWMCAACHGPARQALDNPHRIVLRRAP